MYGGVINETKQDVIVLWTGVDQYDNTAQAELMSPLYHREWIGDVFGGLLMMRIALLYFDIHESYSENVDVDSLAISKRFLLVSRDATRICTGSIPRRGTRAVFELNNRTCIVHEIDVLVEMHISCLWWYQEVQWPLMNTILKNLPAFWLSADQSHCCRLLTLDRHVKVRSAAELDDGRHLRTHLDMQAF